MTMIDSNNILSKIEENIGYISLGNSLTASDVRTFRACFSDFEEKDIKEVIIDMNTVKNIDSSGVGMLVMYYKRQRNKNGVLKLKSLKPEIEEILRLVNVYSLFEII